MPFWYITNTGEAEAPSGPPPLVSRYGSVNRLAPVMVARMTTRVVADRTPGTVTFQKAFTLVAPSTAADSYRSLGTFWSAARESRIEKPSCFQGTNSAITGIARTLFTSHDGFGASGPSIWLTIPLLLKRNNHTDTSATLAVTYGT